MDNLKTIFVNVAVIAVAAVILIGVNTWQRQQNQFAKGEAALAKGEVLTAIGGYEAALHMYTPFGGTVELAAQRLWEIGGNLEQRNDLAKALIAYRALRSSFYSAKWLVQPGKDWIARCDAKTAEILQRQSQQLQQRQ